MLLVAITTARNECNFYEITKADITGHMSHKLFQKNSASQWLKNNCLHKVNNANILIPWGAYFILPKRKTKN